MMCGTSAVGTMPAITPTTPSSVAGANGSSPPAPPTSGPDVAAASGGPLDFTAIIERLTGAITALGQALAGHAALGGGGGVPPAPGTDVGLIEEAAITGGGAPGTGEPGQGHGGRTDGPGRGAGRGKAKGHHKADGAQRDDHGKRDGTADGNGRGDRDGRVGGERGGPDGPRRKHRPAQSPAQVTQGGGTTTTSGGGATGPTGGAGSGSGSGGGTGDGGGVGDVGGRDKPKKPKPVEKAPRDAVDVARAEYTRLSKVVSSMQGKYPGIASATSGTLLLVAPVWGVSTHKASQLVAQYDDAVAARDAALTRMRMAIRLPEPV